MCRYWKSLQYHQQCHPSVVQEVQTNDIDQNTGNFDAKSKDVDIVNMSRLLGLYEQHGTKKDNQLCQHFKCAGIMHSA